MKKPSKVGYFTKIKDGFHYCPGYSNIKVAYRLSGHKTADSTNIRRLHKMRKTLIHLLQHSLTPKVTFVDIIKSFQQKRPLSRYKTRISNLRTYGCLPKSQFDENFYLVHTISSTNENGIFLPKLFWLTVRKNCSSDREKLLQFTAEDREHTKFLRSLEQLIRTINGQKNFW